MNPRYAERQLSACNFAMAAESCSVASRKFSVGAMDTPKLPAGTVLAREIVVGAEGIGYAHVLGVVMNLCSGAEGHDAEEHDFGQARRVLEGTRGYRLTLGGVDPVQFVVFSRDARKLLLRLAEGSV